jgi:hypothetical protein
MTARVPLTPREALDAIEEALIRTDENPIGFQAEVTLILERVEGVTTLLGVVEPKPEVKPTLTVEEAWQNYCNMHTAAGFTSRQRRRSSFQGGWMAAHGIEGTPEPDPEPKSKKKRCKCRGLQHLETCPEWVLPL